MTSRLQLKYGLVSEHERLSNSADALLVTEPTTGSKARTKGSLYLIVTSRALVGRTRDACNLIADTIRREYYYDESAGIAICLEKAIRSANRRLRHSREGGGLAAGSLGLAAAVVRGNELYVATTGDAEAYLVRSARLLMPEHESGEGLPAADSLRVDVWRGDFSVGDSLVLAARNLVEVVGTEELKNAVVTLHPQSAVEHLHHLFVAAGGEGSDAVLAIEATEVALSRVEHRLVPVTPSEPLAGAPVRSPIPLADQFAGAASAVQDRAIAARSRIGESVSTSVGSLLDLMPQRRTKFRRIRPATGRRETERRAAIALLAFLGVVAVLGIGLWYWGGPGRLRENPVSQVSVGEAAFRDAQQKVAQVTGTADLVNTDPPAAQQLLGEAWADLERATDAGVDTAAVAELRGTVADGLNRLHGVHAVTSAQLFEPPAGTEITGLVAGPDEAAYAIVDRSIVRIDVESGDSVTILEAGQGPGAGMEAPTLLARGGPDLLIVDARGNLWRWRPSDTQGGGTLGAVRVSGDQQWGADVADVATFLINPDQGLYRLYVPHVASSQILRYDPAADGSGFSPPTPYFVGESEPVATFRQLLIDGDVYALTGPALLRYFSGRVTEFELAAPPDDGDIRPGHDYRRMSHTGTKGVGQLFIWDGQHARILVFDKAEGEYVEQFVGLPDGPSFSDVRGMYVVDRGEADSPLLVWAGPGGVYRTELSAPTEVDEPSPSPAPTASPTLTPRLQITPQPGSPESSDRPRRTPRATPSA
ncbi:MAG TPA: hypothetical protein VK992_05370 [Candidatus Caenarcaniphilales bacterium]|nr:hypothetical protein [Candidatus Caenarcaniphilales bacterium]